MSWLQRIVNTIRSARVQRDIDRETSVRVLAVASVAGLGLALLFTRGLSTTLYGVTPSDPATVTGVIAMVVTVASLAAAVPAARAAFMSPTRALRED